MALPPLNVLPAKAVLLNTGETLACSTDVLPVHWAAGNRMLQIKGLPREMLAGDETLIIRLDFDTGLTLSPQTFSEFEG